MTEPRPLMRRSRLIEWLGEFGMSESQVDYLID